MFYKIHCLGDVNEWCDVHDVSDERVLQDYGYYFSKADNDGSVSANSSTWNKGEMGRITCYMSSLRMLIIFVLIITQFIILNTPFIVTIIHINIIDNVATLMIITVILYRILYFKY